MTFVPALDTVEVALKFTYGDKTVVNVLNFREPSGVTFAKIQALALIVRDWWSNTMRASFSGGITLVELACRDLTAQNSFVYNLPVSTNNVGTKPGGTTPAQVAIVTSHRTGVAGRGYRGRSYWCGIVESDVDTQIVQTTLATQLGANMTALSTNVSAAGWDWVVVSRWLNGVARVVALISEIASVIVNTRVDTQRRRVKAT